MQNITVDTERLAKVTHLLPGGHQPNKQFDMCAMEAVAYVAREPWSDHPECACPVLAAFVRSWNDGLSDADRNTILLPLIPRLVGSRGSKELEGRRATMAADWSVRTFTPAWLRLAGLDEHADTLASFPEITSFAQTPSIKPALEAARDAAWDAAWAAARAAACDAAWDAAWDAARAAARDAACDAARAAACDAARAAAWDALQKTTKELQPSAIDLLNRMIEAKDAA